MSPASKYTIEIANRQSRHSVPRPLLRAAVRAVLEGEGIAQATISLAIVDDPTMQVLNREYLEHDYPTDVLSFVLDRDGANLEGEIIASADTAANSCGEFGWPLEHELTLYVIHGMLHLVGFDDHAAADRRQMRSKEEQYLAGLQIAAGKKRSAGTRARSEMQPNSPKAGKKRP